MMNSEQKAKVIARLKRAEGQVAGIRRMIENDKYCVDVLLQVSAAQAALGGVGQIVLKQHIETCVTSALSSDDGGEKERTVAELMDVFARYGRFGKT
jgi:DNA-binding FrmR family transcriptional regulator